MKISVIVLLLLSCVAFATFNVGNADPGNLGDSKVPLWPWYRGSPYNPAVGECRATYYRVWRCIRNAFYNYDIRVCCQPLDAFKTSCSSNYVDQVEDVLFPPYLIEQCSSAPGFTPPPPPPPPVPSTYAPSPSTDDGVVAPAPSTNDDVVAPSPSTNDGVAAPVPSTDNGVAVPVPSTNDAVAAPVPSIEVAAPVPSTGVAAPVPSTNYYGVAAPVPSTNDISAAPAPSKEEIVAAPTPSTEEIVVAPVPSTDEIVVAPVPSSPSPAPNMNYF